MTVGGPAIATTATIALVPLPNATGPYYYFTVRAAFSGTVTVSLAFDGSNMTQEQKSTLQMAQFDGGAWVNITTYVDTTNNIIYGNTTHFSFIGIH